MSLELKYYNSAKRTGWYRQKAPWQSEDPTENSTWPGMKWTVSHPFWRYSDSSGKPGRPSLVNISFSYISWITHNGLKKLLPASIKQPLSHWNAKYMKANVWHKFPEMYQDTTAKILIMYNLVGTKLRLYLYLCLPNNSLARLLRAFSTERKSFLLLIKTGKSENCQAENSSKE